MPWCETCKRFFNPNTLLPDGTCHNCGSQVGDPEGQAIGDRSRATVDTQAETTPQKAPWHFKLLVAATVVYVGWRMVEIIGAIIA